MSVIRTLASTENPLFSHVSMSAAAHPLGERGQVDLSDRAGRQERR
jgi:hypothetical protein